MKSELYEIVNQVDVSYACNIMLGDSLIHDLSSLGESGFNLFHSLDYSTTGQSLTRKSGLRSYRLGFSFFSILFKRNESRGRVDQELIQLGFDVAEPISNRG